MLLNPIFAISILIRNIGIEHSRIRQTGQYGHRMAALNKLFAYVRGVKGLRPIMLADNESIHYLAPSPVLTTPSVLSMITTSVLMFLVLMYWRSNMTFSLGSKS